MQNDADAVCKNCFYSHQTEIDPATLSSTLQCWHGPPICTLLPNGRGGIVPVTGRVPVQPGETCGQFRPQLAG